MAKPNLFILGVHWLVQMTVKAEIENGTQIDIPLYASGIGDWDYVYSNERLHQDQPTVEDLRQGHHDSIDDDRKGSPGPLTRLMEI